MNNSGTIILSILIPSIPKRKSMLDKLLAELTRQADYARMHDMLGKIEVVFDDSESFLDGGLSIGKKREKLVKVSSGKYVCFLDDDESISPNYVESLLRLCNFDLDICTFRALAKLRDYWGIVDMRLSYKMNDQFTPEHTVRRMPFHICPVRREFAILYDFDDINNAEDFAWIEKVLTHCTTEAHTDKILFQYNHGVHSEADKIENFKKTK